MISTPKKAVIIVGNGAVTTNNKDERITWLPIKNLKAYWLKGSAYYHFGNHIDEMDDYLFLAMIAIQEKINFKNLILSKQEQGQPNLKQAKAFWADFHELRKELASSYRDIKSQIELKTIPKAIRYLTEEHEMTVVTTNWEHCADRLIDDIHAKGSCLHINGTIEKPETLLFPTQTSWDLMEYYRDHESVIMDTRSKAGEALNDADHIVLWGLALLPQEHELAHILLEDNARRRVDQEKPKRQITIINPDQDARKRAFCLTCPRDGARLVPNNDSITFSAE